MCRMSCKVSWQMRGSCDVSRACSRLEVPKWSRSTLRAGSSASSKRRNTCSSIVIRSVSKAHFALRISKDAMLASIDLCLFNFSKLKQEIIRANTKYIYTGIVQVSTNETTIASGDSLSGKGGISTPKDRMAWTQNQLNVQTGIHIFTIWMLSYGATLAWTANSKLHHNLAKSVSSHRTINVDDRAINVGILLTVCDFNNKFPWSTEIRSNQNVFLLMKWPKR